jgi:hypothetical protein
MPVFGNLLVIKAATLDEMILQVRSSNENNLAHGGPW